MKPILSHRVISFLPLQAPLLTLFDFITAQQRPFRVTFKTDVDEEVTGATAIVNEQVIHPGGIIGFHLNYALQDC